MIVSRTGSDYGKIPTRRLHAPPLLSLEVVTLESRLTKLSFICKSASKAVFRRMQLALHATRRTPHVWLRAWCTSSMPASSSKTRRPPSRHCRDTRVYSHTTTAMHGIGCTHPTIPESTRGQNEDVIGTSAPSRMHAFVPSVLVPHCVKQMRAGTRCPPSNT